MENVNFRIFGLGLGSDDLRYIGWTQKSLNEEREQISASLVERGSCDVAHWVKDALCGGEISIFEIESMPSVEDAKDAVSFWCQYYRSLGLNVASDLL